MEGVMKAAVMTDITQMKLESSPIPKPGPGEVLVKTEYVGICGSDLHYFETGRIADFIVECPFVLGHEASGEVVELGQGVTNLKIGDRVAMEPGKTCGECVYCRTGKYNLCPDVIFFATPPVPGVFQEYVAHEANLCFKLPDNVSTMEGALVEPLAIGVYAAKTAEAQAGQTVVVFGAGCIGYMTLLALRAVGVRKIVVVDILENRLEMADKLGAWKTLNGSKVDVVSEVMRLTENKGCDLVIDTSGNENCVGQGIEMIKKGCNLLLVGYSQNDRMDLPMSLAINKEITFKSIFRYRHMYPVAIDAIAGGLIDVKPMVSNIYELENIQEAMCQSANNKDTIIKSVVKI
jgi:L-iditol 2-dehydrogenase